MFDHIHTTVVTTHLVLAMSVRTQDNLSQLGLLLVVNGKSYAYSTY